MSPWLLVGALLAVAAVAVVALPFLRRPGLSAAEDRLEPDGVDPERIRAAGVKVLPIELLERPLALVDNLRLALQ